jgi:hypothetical protein
MSSIILFYRGIIALGDSVTRCYSLTSSVSQAESGIGAESQTPQAPTTAVHDEPGFAATAGDA